MERIINEKFGCQIINRDNKLLIRFDEGEIAIRFVDYEISEQEAEIAMESEENAYKICVIAQSRNNNFEGVI